MSSAAGACGLALALLAAGCGGGAGGGPEGRPRNAVVFLVDTLRADRLGAYGSPLGLTPRIDAFAAEGLVFERCISQSTWTKPAVASVLTGLRPHRHGVLSAHSALPASVETLPEILRAAGFDTAAFGSNPHVFGAGQGFDQGFGVFEALAPDAEEPFASAERIVDAALAWLDARAGGPFFLYVHVIDPHFPYDAPGHAGAAFDDMEAAQSLPPGERDALRAAYDREVRYTDAQFGRFLDGLAQRGLRADTLIVLLSDHGEEFFEHGGLAHHEGKMFEEVARVPLLLSTPGLPAAARGQRFQGVVEQVDVRATLVDALGLPADRAGSGTSLLLRALSPGSGGRDRALIETEDRGVKKAVVEERWKYVRKYGPGAGEQLYDLRADPGETVDVGAEQPLVLERLRAALAEDLADAPPTYALRVENGGSLPWTVSGGLLARHASPELVEVVGLEGPEAGAQADVLHEGAADERPGALFTLRLAPGDQDEIVFRPQLADLELELDLFADGKPLDPGLLLLGEPGRAALSLPLRLESARASELFAAGDFAPSGGRSVRLWSLIEARGEEGALSAEDEAVLRAVGYVDDGAQPPAPATDR